MSEGQTDEACARFAGSFAIEASSGTLLNLALCHEKQDKTASAWAEYRAAARLSRSQGREDRARVAEEKVAALEPKLARLTAIAEEPVAGEAIATESGTLGEGAIGVPVPIDPGPHTVTVTAPGHRAWSATIEIADEEQRTLAIPELELEPVVVAAPPAPVEVPRLSILSAPAEPSRPRSPRRPTRPDAYLTAGAGALLATGVGFWSAAYFQLHDAQDLCNAPPGCSDVERQDRVSTIQTLKWIAAGSWVAGGGLALAAGAHVWLSKAPADWTPGDAAASWRSNLRVTRTILLAAGGAALVAAAGFGLRALDKRHQYESDPACAYTCPALADAHQAANIATGFAIAGATLGIAGAATLLYRPVASDTGTRPRHGLAVFVGDRQLSLAGSF